MSDSYHAGVAAHYQAFRPDLHRRMLRRCLTTRRFERALDVGSGVGHSSLALVDFAAQIVGIDPSSAMIDRAEGRAEIQYRVASAESLPWREARFDLITFAGTLPYVDLGQVVGEIERVLRPEGTVLVYDFEIVLQPWWDRLRLTPPYSRDTYDHRLNFSGIPSKRLVEINQLQETIAVEARSDQLAHLLLADAPIYTQWNDRAEKGEAFEQLVDAIGNASNLEARLFATEYVSQV